MTAQRLYIIVAEDVELQKKIATEVRVQALIYDVDPISTADDEFDDGYQDFFTAEYLTSYGAGTWPTEYGEDPLPNTINAHYIMPLANAKYSGAETYFMSNQTNDAIDWYNDAIDYYDEAAVLYTYGRNLMLAANVHYTAGKNAYAEARRLKDPEPDPIPNYPDNLDLPELVDSNRSIFIDIDLHSVKLTYVFMDYTALDNDFFALYSDVVNLRNTYYAATNQYDTMSENMKNSALDVYDDAAATKQTATNTVNNHQGAVTLLSGDLDSESFPYSLVREKQYRLVIDGLYEASETAYDQAVSAKSQMAKAVDMMNQSKYWYEHAVNELDPMGGM